MTGYAVRVRTRERSPYMAAFATNIGVGTIKIEAGAEMVEGWLCERRLSKKQYEDTNHLRHKLTYVQRRIHRIDRTLRKLSAEWQRAQSSPKSPSCISSER